MRCAARGGAGEAQVEKGRGAARWAAWEPAASALGRAGQGAPRSPQGSAPRRAQTMGSLCPAPPPLARRPAPAPSPQSCFQFKRLQPAGAAPGGATAALSAPVISAGS